MARRDGAGRQPIGFIRPTIDGAQTDFYEWHEAGRYRLAAGGSSMHQGAGLASDLYVGYDDERLHLRVDFVAGKPPGEDHELLLEFLVPTPLRIEIRNLAPGIREPRWRPGSGEGERVDGAVAAVGDIVEASLPFTSLGLAAGDAVELLARLTRGGQSLEALPSDDVVRLRVPAAEDDARAWSA
jgi:hypothetical protein